jgi:uncharacterized protein DUF6090
MLNFLRKLRRDNMNGKPARPLGGYFKYAIGEIFLVVIGILIALTINNWNEDRKKQIQENVILHNLKSEFKSNLKFLEIEISRMDKSILGTSLIFKSLEVKEQYYSEQEIDSLLSESLWVPIWSISEFVLQELKNSGGMSRLKDENLKNQLYQWSQAHESVKEQIKILSKVNVTYIDFIKANGSLRNVDRFSEFISDNPSILDISNMDLLENPQFENVLDDKLFTSRDTNKQYREIKKLIEQILKSIPDQ